MVTAILAVGLIVWLVVAMFLFYKWRQDVKFMEEEMQRQIQFARADAISKSRATLEGKIAENFVPHLPGWKYAPSDCKFMSAPIDYVVFSGLHKDKVEEVVFVEVKQGNSSMTKRQRSVKKAIEEGRVRYELYRVEDKNGTEN